MGPASGVGRVWVEGRARRQRKGILTLAVGKRVLWRFRELGVVISDGLKIKQNEKIQRRKQAIMLDITIGKT